MSLEKEPVGYIAPNESANKRAKVGGLDHEEEKEESGTRARGGGAAGPGNSC